MSCQSVRCKKCSRVVKACQTINGVCKNCL